MTKAIVALALCLLVAPLGAMAQETGNRSPAVCKSVNRLPDKAAFADLSEDDLKEKMCLSSLSVVRSADYSAGLECQLAYKALMGEFSRRHPGKEMVDVYGRC